MATLDYRTAGESHGQALITLIEGLPANVPLDIAYINMELRRRQGGYGRGGRMRIEQDEANILTGIRLSRSIGSPIAMQIINRDSRIDTSPAIARPRPGHADFAGSMKFLTTDCRNTLERASARETTARVAAGAVASCLLHEFGIEVVGYVRQIHGVSTNLPVPVTPASADQLAALKQARDANEAYCPDAIAAEQMINVIHQTMVDKDTVGGVVEVQVHGCPPGLGSCMRWQDKLDGRIMQAVGSVQAMKAVEIGLGFGVAERVGSLVHDEIDYQHALQDTPSLGFVRRSNNAGGLEGGMTNGAPIVIRAAMKPISTLLKGMDSVNLTNRQPERSDYERSDICAVPACSVVVQHVVAFEIARAFLEKFGGDTLQEVHAAYAHFMQAASRLGE